MLRVVAVRVMLSVLTPTWASGKSRHHFLTKLNLFDIHWVLSGTVCQAETAELK